jgi:hypothetical protein
MIQCPDCLNPSAVVHSVLSAIGSGDLQPALLALSLLFQRGDALYEVDFRLLFDLISGDDPRVTAAVYLCLARAIEQGADIAALCYELVTIPADFLGKRECARCICHLILNADESDIERFTRTDWVDLMYEILDTDDCEFGVLILRAFCRLAENEATRQMVVFERMEEIMDAGSHADVTEESASFRLTPTDNTAPSIHDQFCQIQVACLMARSFSLCDRSPVDQFPADEIML